MAERLNLPLVAIAVSGFALTAYFTLQVTGWAIMTDELQHVKLAESIADTLSPLPHVRGEPLGAYAQLYPLLTAPVYGLFDMPTAFRVVHGLNALIMASTAIPAYLLARSVTQSRPLAWVVAALTVAVPWMGMAHLIMTEAVAYPAFAWATLGLYNALANPRPRNDLLAFAGLALAALARTQFLMLALALPVAVIVHELGFAARHGNEGRLRLRLFDAGRRLLRQHAVLATVTITGAAGYVLGQRGSLESSLGNYSTTLIGPLIPSGTGRIAGELWAVLGVGIGIIPVVAAAGWAASMLVRPTDRRGHAFAVLLIVIGTLLTWEVSSFLVRYSGAVQDRYFFYLLPLVFTGMAACLRDPRARSLGVLVASGAFAWLTTLSDFTPAAQKPFWASPPATFNAVLSGRSWELGDLLGFQNLGPRPVLIAATAIAGVALAVALWRLRRLPSTVVVCGVVLIFCVAETAYTNNKFAEAMSAQPIGRAWVDDHLPAGVRAAIWPGGVNATATNVPVSIDLWSTWGVWWNVEFWNKSADRAVNYEADPVAGNAPFAQRPLTVDKRTGALRGTVDRSWFVVSYSDVRQRLFARSVYVDPVSALELVRGSHPLRLDWMTTGLPHDGVTPPGEPVTIRIFSPVGSVPRERRVTVFANATQQLKEPTPYILSSAGQRTTQNLAVNGVASSLEMTICVAAPYNDIKLRVPPSPANGPNPLSLHVARIAVDAPDGRCRPGG